MYLYGLYKHLWLWHHKRLRWIRSLDKNEWTVSAVEEWSSTGNGRWWIPGCTWTFYSAPVGSVGFQRAWYGHGRWPPVDGKITNTRKTNMPGFHLLIDNDGPGWARTWTPNLIVNCAEELYHTSEGFILYSLPNTELYTNQTYLELINILFQSTSVFHLESTPNIYALLAT